MIPTVESSSVEFKVQLSKTYLKTVSAFANYGTGSIYFGVDDDGVIVGVTNPRHLVMRIEQQVNAAIEPRPRYTLEVLEGNVVHLRVLEGQDQPYFYQQKAYRRGDTSTVQVDRAELQHLFLRGANRTFDELPVRNEELSFDALQKALQAKTHIDVFGMDILKTLGLYTDSDGYNQAALLLADSNDCPGIDIVRFGDSADVLHGRIQLAGQSIIQQFTEALEYFDQFYVYEKVEGFSRRQHERIPRQAFRETLANALAHRDWASPAAIQIAFYADRVELTSPGGLPAGISEEVYLNQYYAVPRNPVIASVFQRLGYIEGLGTGIDRIRRAYLGFPQVPGFDLRDSSIRITLPEVADLDATDSAVFEAIGHQATSRAEIEKATGLSKARVIRVLAELEAKGMIKRLGAGPSTRYSKA